MCDGKAKESALQAENCENIINSCINVSLRVWHKLNLVYQISTCLCNVDHVYKALLITKNTQNKQQKAFPAKNIIQINNIFTFGQEKTFDFPVCMHTGI